MNVGQRSRICAFSRNSEELFFWNPKATFPLSPSLTVSCFNANVTGLLLYPRLGFQPYSIEARQDRDGKPVALIHLRRLSGSRDSSICPPEEQT